MLKLTVESRNKNLNGKQLRKSGIVPAVFYGKNLDQSISIQLPEAEALKFLKQHSVGSQLDLVLDSKPYMAVLKDVKLTPMNYRLEHIDFQALTAGEPIRISSHIVFINTDQIEVDGILSELIHEIDLECLPKDLPEQIEIDISGLKIGDSIALGDLPIASDSSITIHTPLDTLVATVSAPKVEIIEETEEEASAEVPVIGEDEASEE